MVKSAPRNGTLSTLPKKVRTRFEAVGAPVPPHLERQLTVIEQLNAAVKEATEDVSAWAEANPICVRLMTAPGVGALTSLRFVAAIDRIERFPEAHQLEAYLGLTPGEDSSSERRRITSITKAGPSAVRWTLVQATWTALRVRPEDPMCTWARQVAHRRGIRVAVVALARKLAGVLFAMWRDGTDYQPRLVKAAETPAEL
jgi:transposase